MTREQIYQENICKYCKASCNKKIEVIKEESTICTKCVDYEPKETIKRKKAIQYWHMW